ncbi:MAG TPA: 3-dehydroquinate synthase [Candidatus Kapabacteria bacterium]|nr:3-dehydroquinate synthase [Candidatus Kapabacteria bacterium]
MNWRGRNIYLTGLPGAGKTSIGREFAKLLAKFNYEFVDLDAMIEAQTGLTVPQIINERGEAHFREIETIMLAHLSEHAFHDPKVVAMGGGTVIRPMNRAIMRGSGLVIHIDVTVRQAAKNIINGILSGQERPLLKAKDPDELTEKVRELYESRKEFYDEATLHFVARGRESHSPQELAIEMQTALGELSKRVRLAPTFTTTLAHSALGDHPVLVGNGIAQTELGPYLRSSGFTSVVIVTDATVDSLHTNKLVKKLASQLGDGVVLHKIVIEPGEASKERNTLFELLEYFDSADLERRSSAVLAIGGGVVTDIAGFAASIYKRGIPVIHVPTTLLAQVDASIGGKTGIDFNGAKNALGSFYAPAAVIIDPLFLKTLDKRELHAGLAEIYKCGLIGNKDFWTELATAVRRLTRGVDQSYAAIIRECIREKLKYVEEDEFEKKKGVRELLNFGHTFAHALESATGFTQYLHGEAVLLGMRAASWLSMQLGHLDEEEWTRIELVLGRIPVKAASDFNESLVLAKMNLDKKREKGSHRLILLRGIGEAFVCDNISEKDVRGALQFMRSIA